MTRKRKYNSTPTVIDGVRFDSKKEAKRYWELKILQTAGKISKLELQPAFKMVVNGKKICRYTADFQYFENGKKIVEDVKSKATKTRDYRIRVKLLDALYGIQIVET